MAGECIEALVRHEETEQASVGGVLIAEGIGWLVAIGNGLSNVRK